MLLQTLYILLVIVSGAFTDAQVNHAVCINAHPYHHKRFEMCADNKLDEHSPL